MKKLMMAVAIVCAAAFAQAASVDWTLSVKNSVMLQDGSAAAGTTVFLVLANDATAFDALKAGLVSGDITAANITANALYVDQAQTGTGKNAGKIATVTSDISLAAGSTATLAFIAFDTNDAGDWVYVSSTTTGDVWGGDYIHDLANPALWDAGYYSASNWSAVESVPEPTSGLLLLLGMAGLALRRRRA